MDAQNVLRDQQSAGASPATGQAARCTVAGEAGLDLSLGHFGTREEDSSIQVEEFGPFKVVFDLRAGTGRVVTDASAFRSRQERRAAEREFIKVVTRIGHETGFDVSLGGSHENP